MHQCHRKALARLRSHPYYRLLPAKPATCLEPLDASIMHTPWGPLAVSSLRPREAARLAAPLCGERLHTGPLGGRAIRLHAPGATGRLLLYGEPAPLAGLAAVVAGPRRARLEPSTCTVEAGGALIAEISPVLKGAPLDRAVVGLIRGLRTAQLLALARLIGEALARAHEALWSVDERANHRITPALLQEWAGRPRRRLPIVRGLAPPRLYQAYRDALRGLEPLLSRLARDAPAREAGPSHGDLHLGQLLLAPGRRIAILDFEGEPYKYPARKTLPESPERDLASLARSLHYAAEHAGGAPEHHKLASQAWTTLLEAYARTAPIKPSPSLTTLWILERATYELVYELTEQTGLHGIPLKQLQNPPPAPEQAKPKITAQPQ